MSNTITKDRKSFAQIPNDLLNNLSISLAAKGLYSFMESKPSSWNFTIRSMAKQLKEGETAITTALNELKKFGWLSYAKHSDGKGVYHLFWTAQPIATSNPDADNPVLDKPEPEKPNQGFPMKGKPQRISNKEPVVKKIGKDLKEPMCAFTESFETFWKLYPKKVDKKKTLQLWLKLKPSAELVNTIMQSLGKYCVSEGWTKDHGKFVPHASTWLNAERWNDEVQVGASKTSQPDFMGRHTGFADRDYGAGLKQNEDGTYEF